MKYQSSDLLDHDVGAPCRGRVVTRGIRELPVVPRGALVGQQPHVGHEPCSVSKQIHRNSAATGQPWGP